MANKRIKLKKAKNDLQRYEEEFKYWMALGESRQEQLSIDGSCQGTLFSNSENTRFDFIEGKVLSAMEFIYKNKARKL